jgi:simple sugar transport system ATP-binding protein
LPEDRHSQGLFRTKTITDNLTAATLEQLRRFLIIDQTRAKEESNKVFNELRIKASSMDTIVETLSGGNQQRVVLGKWLATNPKLFILDSPTVGIDVGSKSEIYEIIHELARNRMAIIMISDEIPEIYHNCNRIIVMRDGKITATVNTSDTTEDELRSLVEGRA